MIYDQLSQLKLFQNISQKSIDCLNSMNVLERDYKKDQLVDYFGDPIRYINVITKGCLKTNEYKLDGKEIVSSYYFAYDAFPFYLVYGGASKYPYNVYCHQNAHVLHLPVKPLTACIESDPVFLKNLLVFISEYCITNKKVIQTATFSKVVQRLAFWLLMSIDDDGHFIMPGTQETFSDILLVNRSTLNQELRKLERDGIISIKGQRIKVLDHAYLENLLEFTESYSVLK